MKFYCFSNTILKSKTQIDVFTSTFAFSLEISSLASSPSSKSAFGFLSLLRNLSYL